MQHTRLLLISTHVSVTCENIEFFNKKDTPPCDRPTSNSLSFIPDIPRGVPRIWEGGGGEGKNFFFEIWKFACREA